MAGFAPAAPCFDAEFSNEGASRAQPATRVGASDAWTRTGEIVLQQAVTAYCAGGARDAAPVK